MSAFRLPSRRSALRLAALTAVACCLPLAACDSISGIGQDPSATGTWVGSYFLAGDPDLGSVPLTLSIRQLEGGVLEGDGEFTTGTGVTPFVMSGQHSHPSVSGRLILADGSMDLSASMDSGGEAITGQLRAGPVTAELTLNKQ